MLDQYPSRLPSLQPSSSSFAPLAATACFASSKPVSNVKRIDFPIKPHLLKYLQVHLKLERDLASPGLLPDYLLSKTNRFGFALNQLLRKPAKSARHESSIEDCTMLLGVDLRNFNAAYYDLLQGKLSAYCIFQFNDFVDDNFKAELYWWVREHHQRRSTIKDAIRSFMVFYDVTEDDLSYETLRKSVQRNGELKPRRKTSAKSDDFPMNLSHKMGGMSQKKSGLSQKTGVMSQKATFAAVRQTLMHLPLPLFETDFFYAGR